MKKIILLSMFVLSFGCASLEANATSTKKTNTVENVNHKKTNKKKSSKKSKRCDCTLCDPCGNRGVERCLHKGRAVYCKFCHKTHIRCKDCTPNDASGCQCDGICDCG